MLGGDEVLSAPPISWFHDDDLAAAAPSSDDEEDERQEEEKEEKDGDDNSCCCNSPEDEAIAAEIQRRHDARQDTFQQQQQLKQHESKYEIQQSDRDVRNNSNGSTRNQTTNTTTTTTTTTLEQQQYHPKKTPPLASFRLNPPLSSTSRVAPSPSWKEMGQYVLPSAAKELLSSSLRRVCYTARLSYAMGRWHRKYSDLGNNSGGFFRPNLSPNLNQQLQQRVVELPAVSNLPWVDRQMVREWRTYLPQDNIATDNKHNKHNNNGTKRVDDDEDIDFDRARTLVPQPLQRPRWQKADLCHECYKPFGPTRLRHHCRLCGYSYCQLHSGSVHTLPQLGYDPEVPERVCDPCKRACLLQNLAERVAWRLARCRDLQEGQLTPYFETGIDTMEQAALRIAHAALATARSIPLGAQAHVAVETVEVLRRHGLNGIYGIMLRKEFLAAADLLREALGINKTAWPLSVHELSAAIFYALAQHRAMRGINPDREEIIHTLINDNDDNGNSMSTTASSRQSANENIVIDETDEYNPDVEHLVSLVKTVAEPLDCAIPNTKLLKDTMTCSSTAGLPFTPVCTPVPDHVLNSLIFYAPIALTFIYATKEVDMQLLAAQQGWKLLYACLNPDKERDGGMVSDIPASAVFVHEQQKTACLAIRGTATIHDVVTDLRQVPVPFPEVESGGCEGWTNVTDSKGLAVCGMASAALNLFREHIDVLLHLVREGYKIRITGHSLGGGVATLIGVLILKELEDVMALEKFKPIKLPELLRVYAYGPPSSVDAPLAEFTESFVTTAVLHDDVVPRLTPTSCRGLLKHLLHIRETWVKAHLEDDLLAIGERASLAWAPRWRSGFTLTSASKVSLRRSSRLIKRVGKKMIKSGTKQIVSVAMAAAASAQQQASGSGLSPKDDKQKADKQEEAAKNKKIDSGVHVDDPAFSPIHDHFSVPRASVSQGPAATHDTAEDTNGTNDQEKEPKLLVEIMGGLDSRSNAVIIDGEEFFEADENLIETEEDSLATTEMFADAFDEARRYVKRTRVFGLLFITCILIIFSFSPFFFFLAVMSLFQLLRRPHQLLP